MKLLRKYWPLLIAALLLPLYLYVAWGGYHELFVTEPGIHSSRIDFEENTWGDTTVWFTVNTPTVAPFCQLMGGLLAVYGVIKLYWAYLLKRPLADKIRYGVYQALGLIIGIVAILVFAFDVFTTAFEGVG